MEFVVGFILGVLGTVIIASGYIKNLNKELIKEIRKSDEFERRFLKDEKMIERLLYGKQK